MKKHGPIGWLTWILLIVGGLNWGLVGINPEYNLVSMSLGADTTVARAVYIIIGVAALLAIYFKAMCCKNNKCCNSKECCNNRK